MWQQRLRSLMFLFLTLVFALGYMMGRASVML